MTIDPTTLTGLQNYVTQNAQQFQNINNNSYGGGLSPVSNPGQNTREAQFNYGGSTYYYSPSQWGGRFGNATLSPQQAASLGGSQVNVPGFTTQTTGSGEVASYGAPAETGYIFSANPGGALSPGANTPGVSYTPGSGGDFLKEVANLISIPAAAAGAYFLGPALGGVGDAAAGGSSGVPSSLGILGDSATTGASIGGIGGTGVGASYGGALGSLSAEEAASLGLGAGAGLDLTTTMPGAGAVTGGANGGILADQVAPGMTGADLLSGSSAALPGMVPGNLGANVIDPAIAGGMGGLGGGYSTTAIPGIGASVPSASAGGAGAAPSFWSTEQVAGLTGKDLVKLGIPAAGLASSLLGKKGIPQADYLKNEQAQYGAQGQQLLTAAANNQLTPSQQQAVDTFKQQQMASAKQYLATTGQGADSTAMLGMKANIDAQALLLQQGFVQQTFQQGLSLMGVADQATAQLIQGQLYNDARTSQALQNFLMSYGLLFATS